MYKDPLNAPDNYTPMISNITLMEQLEILKKLKPWLCKDKEGSSCSKVSPKPGSTKDKSSEETEKKSPTSGKSGKKIKLDKKQMPRGSVVASVPIDPRDESQEEFKKRLISQKQAENYRVVTCDLINNKVVDKLKMAYPYNIFLTVVTDSKPTHKEMLSISLPG
jgi:tyrosyl-DNA phosphodiesterase-1